MAELAHTAASEDEEANVMSEGTRKLVTLAVMLSAIMVLLDMTIANVALPHMMGALGVTSDQVTWVLTSYSMAESDLYSTGQFSGAEVRYTSFTIDFSQWLYHYVCVMWPSR